MKKITHRDSLDVAIARSRGLIKRDELADMINVRINEKNKTVSFFSPEYILYVVRSYVGIDNYTMQSRTRKRQSVEARQLAQAAIRIATKLGTKKTGSIVGKKDHSTVIYSSKIVSNLILTDKVFKEKYMPMFSLLNISEKDIHEIANNEN